MPVSASVAPCIEGWSMIIIFVKIDVVSLVWFVLVFDYLHRGVMCDRDLGVSWLDPEVAKLPEVGGVMLMMWIT